MRQKQRSFKKALKNSFTNFMSMMPMILAIIGLVDLFQTFITEEMLAKLFTGNSVKDTLIGTVTGAIAVGQPFVSYIIGGELLEEGISLYAVTAFILAWVTLGIVQLPAEAEVLGKQFTFYRNILAFIFTLLVSILTAWTVELLK
ncbi:permease [Hydrogenimonas thermophila]|uniref:permease n=1 Tax=Hydrogenimonas thermophila TaxID=223786 RepID=UPI002936F426|nr:permease [Hydrogenimonas thermophila]WOE68780.1 permease [Hydrogenimonas thermophila]WOE71290.1 permease [Hydrogenimonas thermophila]